MDNSEAPKKLTSKSRGSKTTVPQKVSAGYKNIIVGHLELFKCFNVFVRFHGLKIEHILLKKGNI